MIEITNPQSLILSTEIFAAEKGVCPRAFGKGSDTKEDLDETISVLTASGSLDYVKNLAVSFVEEGKAKLDILPDSSSKQLLKDMADYMLYRDY